MKRIGFTGSREGMTDPQRQQFRELMVFVSGISVDQDGGVGREDFEFHHGDCLGSDLGVHILVAEAYPEFVTIHIHPPLSSLYRAFCDGRDHHDGRKIKTVMHPCAPYLERDHDIVDQTDILIATPRQELEVIRSGTWATIRYARKKHLHIYIIGPRGKIKEER